MPKERTVEQNTRIMAGAEKRRKATTTKKAAKKSTRKAEPETRKNSPIPFGKIARLYTDGKTMEQIAKAVNRFNETYPDPTKSVRAIISGMLTKGFKNDQGRTIKLKKRARGKVVEAKPTAKKRVKKVVAKKPESTPKVEAVSVGK